MTLADVAAEVLPAAPHNKVPAGYTAMVGSEIVDVAVWSRYKLQPGEQIIFAADIGFLAALLAWALPAIFTPAALAGSVLGPITWAGVFNTIGWLGASYLINSLMPKPKLPGLDGSVGSPAQSWEPRTTQQESLVIPRTYGTFRVHGNIIGCHTAPSGDGREQQIFALISFADGPVASVTDIRINGRQASNLPDLTTEIRRGVVEQSNVSFFDKTRLQYRLNVELTVAGGAEIFEVPDDDYDDLEIMFRANCWHRFTNGDKGSVAAELTVDIRERGGGWTNIVNPVIIDSETEIKWVEYKISDYYALIRGKLYDLRITKVNTDWNEDRRQNQVWIEAIKEVIDVAFTYPGMVLIGLNGLASEELPGFLDISALLGPRVVDTYDGQTWALSESTGADNPAWVGWDLATLPLITGDGVGTPYAIDHYRGFSTDRVDATDFFTLSQFTTEQVPDADGNDEDLATFHGIFDYESNILDAILIVAEVGRFLPVWNGNKITLAINKAKGRSGIITVANILKGSFEETFAPTIDAASEIEAEFHESTRDYNRRVIPFNNPNQLNKQNRVTLDLAGFTKLSEVVRHIKQRLAATELRQRTIVTDCGIDAIGYRVGDLLGVQEDVTDWETLDTRGGGHIVKWRAGLSGYVEMNCVAHWKLNDNNWTLLVADSTGNGYNATAQRNTAQLHIPGIGGGAHYFNGLADYHDTDDPFEAIFQGSFSISLRLKPDDGHPGSIQKYFGVQDLSGTDSYVSCRLLSDGVVRWHYHARGAVHVIADTDVPVFSNGAALGWTDVLFVFDSTINGPGGMKIYIQGNNADLDSTNNGDTTGVISANFVSAFNPFIGAENFNDSGTNHGYFAGGIDNVMLFGKALTASDARKLHNDGAGREHIDYDTVTVDHEIGAHLEAGQTYEIAIRLKNANAPVIRTLLPADAGEIEVDGHFSGLVPAAGDVWAIGVENLVLKDFTIEQIQRSGDLRSRLTLLEYDPDVFDTDTELPLIPVSNAVIARADRRLDSGLTRRDLRTQIPPAAMEYPTMDIPTMQNITWNTDTPAPGSVSWSATDAGEPLLVTFNGTTYEITASSTANAYIYWVPGSATFGKTNTLATALDGTNWLMAVNESGAALPTFGRKSIHGAIIQAGTITAALAQIAAATIGTANIIDLNVTTLKIKDNAVTVPVSAFTAAGTVVGAALTTVQSVAITTTADPLFVLFTATVTTTGVDKYIDQIQILRGANVIYDDADNKDVFASAGSTIAISISITPPAEAETYHVKVKADQTNITVSNKSLLLLGVKK